MKKLSDFASVGANEIPCVKAFNADISKWDILSCKRMDFMFCGAMSFNVDIGKCHDNEEYF